MSIFYLHYYPSRLLAKDIFLNDFFMSCINFSQLEIFVESDEKLFSAFIFSLHYDDDDDKECDASLSRKHHVRIVFLDSLNYWLCNFTLSHCFAHWSSSEHEGMKNINNDITSKKLRLATTNMKRSTERVEEIIHYRRTSLEFHSHDWTVYEGELRLSSSLSYLTLHSPSHFALLLKWWNRDLTILIAVLRFRIFSSYRKSFFFRR